METNAINNSNAASAPPPQEQVDVAVEKKESLKLQEAKVQPKAEKSADVAKADSPQETEQSEKARRTAESVALSNVLKNVSLRFNVDPETKKINVMVVDKDTGDVVRIIPPEELSNLNEGKLLELFI